MTSVEAPRAIDSQGALDEALGAIAAAPRFALDTEFMRVDTYAPRFCLLQVATPEAIYCIDPLAGLDLHGLGACLVATRGSKIMHAARQDLEVLETIGAGVLEPLFDTQIAAALLGLSDQISYAALVEQYCDVRLDKSHTRTDWARRPLSEGQLRYAALDVAYLLDVWAALAREIDAQGKRAWLEEECRRLLSARDDASPPITRVKGASQLQGRSLAVAHGLAEWREGAARAADRPRNWILRDEVLLAIARRLPRSMGELGDVPDLPPGTVRRHGAQLLTLVEAPPVLPEGNGPVRPPRLSPAGNRLLGELQQRVRERAEASRVAPTLLASRRDLEQVVVAGRSSRLEAGWRGTLIGRELLELRAACDGEALTLPA